MNTKAPPTNAIQRSKLLQMVDENPVLITRKLTNQFTFEMFNNLWVQVKEELNRLGPCKEVKGWQKYLTDQKSRVKKKKSEITLSYRKTGGGTDEIPDLNGSDEKLLAAMGGRMVIEGDELVHEFGLEPESNSRSNRPEDFMLEDFVDHEVEVESKRVNECVSSQSSSSYSKPTCSTEKKSKVSAGIDKWNASMESNKISVSKLKENLMVRKDSKTAELLRNKEASGKPVSAMTPRNRKRRLTQEDFEHTVGFRDKCLKEQTEALKGIATALSERNKSEEQKNHLLQKILEQLLKNSSACVNITET